MEQLEAKSGELSAGVDRRCRFIIGENARVLELAEALPRGDRAAMRRLCDESFLGACELYEISSSSMVSMMGAMSGAPGVIGARQAGAGFGGCMVALVESEMTEDFRRSVSHEYLRTTGLQAEVYPVEAAAGAGLLSFEN